MSVTTQEKDYLEQDPSVRGQNYVCLSFLSPEDVINSRDSYAMARFMKSFSGECKELFGNLKKMMGEGDDDRVKIIDNVMERYKYVFDSADLKLEYDAFMKTNANAIDTDYLQENNFKSSVRGLKVRGTYETLAEAQVRAEKLRKVDPLFSVYVAEVGCWIPWSPDPDDIKDSHYAETQLNTIMQRYQENVEEREELYNQRKDLIVGKRVDSPDGTPAGGDGASSSSSSPPEDIISSEALSVSVADAPASHPAEKSAEESAEKSADGTD